MESLKVNDIVSHHSAMGFYYGTVSKIELGMNGEGKLIPWVSIAVKGIRENGIYEVRFPATDDYLKMMSVTHVSIEDEIATEANKVQFAKHLKNIRKKK